MRTTKELYEISIHLVVQYTLNQEFHARLSRFSVIDPASLLNMGWTWPKSFEVVNDNEVSGQKRGRESRRIRSRVRK